MPNLWGSRTGQIILNPGQKSTVKLPKPLNISLKEFLPYWTRNRYISKLPKGFC